jgi:hypothetical protein
MHRRLMAIRGYIQLNPDCTVQDITLNVDGCTATIYNNLASLKSLGVIEEYKDDFGITRYKVK